MLLVTALCLISLTPVWSSTQCGDLESFYVGDGNIKWEASIGSREGLDIFYPSTNEFYLGGRKATLVLSTTTRANHLKVKQISLEVNGVRKVQIGSKSVTVSGGKGYQRVTFDLNDNVNSVSISITGRGNSGSVRSVFISGCFDANMVSINKGLDLFKAKWEQGIPVADFIDQFYTDDAIFIEPSQDIRYTPKDIAKYIFSPVQEVRPKVNIDIILAEKLSEVRLFTIHLAVFFDKYGIADPPRRYFILWRKDEINGGFKVNRVCVNYKDVPTKLMEDIKNLSNY